MRDYAFYNVGCAKAKGMARLLVPVRRLFRRILRPMLFRQAHLLAEMDWEVNSLSRQMDHLEGLLTDQEAVARRLATLEDCVNTLTQHSQRRQASGDQPLGLRKAG